jgi:guanine deaminase
MSVEKKSESNEKHEDFINKTIDLALKNLSVTNGGPFAALITRGDEIIAMGVNAVVPNLDPTAHAEIIVIREAAKILKTIDLKECVLYTSCEPCPMCLGASQWAGIQKIYFALTMKDAERMGFEDALFYEKFRNPKSLDYPLTINLRTPDADRIIEKWLNKSNKTMY